MGTARFLAKVTVLVVSVFAIYISEADSNDRSTCKPGDTKPLQYFGGPHYKFLNNPRNASEFCGTFDDETFTCAEGFAPGPVIQQIQHLQCVSQPQAKQFKQDVQAGTTLIPVNNEANPICIRYPKICVCANSKSHLKAFAEPIDPENQIFFLLLSSSNNFVPRKINNSNLEDLLSSGYIVDAETKVICHGFLSSSDLTKDGPAKALSEAYIARTRKTRIPINIILVDWSALSGNNDYDGVSGKISMLIKGLGKAYALPRIIHWHVGWYTARLIEYLVVCGGADRRRFHLIGHSLGGHALGLAGQMFNTRRIGKLGRLTLMDAAGPCFDNFSSVQCFTEVVTYKPASESDADFVDAIHTHGEVLGMKNRMGHVDFYVNGGLCQPCPWWTVCRLSTCSHSRSYELMAASIEGPKGRFKSTGCTTVGQAMEQKCTNQTFVANMGEYCEPGARGIFYVKTNSNAPFAGIPLK